jgi:hypothetical protein
MGTRLSVLFLLMFDFGVFAFWVIKRVCGLPSQGRISLLIRCCGALTQWVPATAAQLEVSVRVPTASLVAVQDQTTPKTSCLWPNCKKQKCEMVRKALHMSAPG